MQLSSAFQSKHSHLGRQPYVQVSLFKLIASLQPKQSDCHCDVTQDPVCTPEGFIFSKEAIIENLVQQKKVIKRKQAAWQAQQADDQQKVSSDGWHREHKQRLTVSHHWHDFD